MKNKGIQVSDTKEAKLDGSNKEEGKLDKIQVVAGNIPILSVQLLNSINLNLVEILKELRAQKNV